MLDEKAANAYSCANCPRSLQKIRNCDNQYDPVKLWVNKTSYQQCPVSIGLRDLELKQMVGMYLQARGSKIPFVKGDMMSQTNWYYEFSSLIEGKINKNQSDQLEDAQKEIEKKTKKGKGKTK